MAVPTEGARVTRALLLCLCLWSHLYEGQELVPKHPRVPGAVLAPGGCRVQNSLCQGRTQTPPTQGRSGAGHINKLLWLFSLSGGVEGWLCQVPSRWRCVGPAPASGRWPVLLLLWMWVLVLETSQLAPAPAQPD